MRAGLMEALTPHLLALRSSKMWGVGAYVGRQLTFDKGAYA